MLRPLFEPNATDRVITNVTDLLSAIAGGRSTGISLHLVGNISLASAPPSGTGPTLVPNINEGQRVTLWSEMGATLDAAGMGRLFYVLNGGQLLLQNIHVTGGASGTNGGGCLIVQSLTSRLVVREALFSNCTTQGFSGGGILIIGGVVEITDSAFHDCEVLRVDGTVRGGGIAIEQGIVTLNRTRLERTRVRSETGEAFGGGIALWNAGDVVLDGVTFVNASASSERSFAYGGGLGVRAGNARVYSTTWVGSRATSRTEQAWGGGIGLDGGTAVVFDSMLLGTDASSTDREAWGGGLGLNAGTATLYGSSMLGCDASGGTIGDGGGVGVLRGGQAYLYNVTLVNSSASSSDHGVAIVSNPQQLTAALLSIRQPCVTAEEAARPVIQVNGNSEGFLLLRNLTIDAPGCDAPLDAGSRLLQCDDATDAFGRHVCGANTVCTTSNGTFPTPLCECQQNDFSQPFVQPMASPNARSAVIAPYLPEGCVQPTLPEQWTLNPNWWRSSERTRDVRLCREDWPYPQAGVDSAWTLSDVPTPCRGGRTTPLPDDLDLDLANTLGDTSDGARALGYCEPGQMGPLCKGCVDREGQYYDTVVARCVDCPITGAVAVVSLGGLLLGTAALAWLMCLPLRRGRNDSRASNSQLAELVSSLSTRAFLREHADRAVSLRASVALAHAWIVRTVSQLGIVAKTKVALAYYQVRLCHGPDRERRLLSCSPRHVRS